MFNPLNLITKFIKSSNQKELDKIAKIVEKINSHDKNFKNLSDTDFPKKTKEFKNQIRIVFGTLDKIDQLKIIDLFPENYIYYFCNVDSERAMNMEKILIKARQNKLNFKSFNKSKNALGQAMNDSSKNDVVFVIGSVYLISEILS